MKLNQLAFHFPSCTFRHLTSLSRHFHLTSSNVRVYRINLCPLLNFFIMYSDRCHFGMPLYLPKSTQSFGFRPQTSIVLLIRYHPHEVISLPLILCFNTHNHKPPQVPLLLCLRNKIYLSFVQGSNLRGKEFNLTLHWHVMPKTGKMLADKLVMSGFRLPEEYR